MTINKNKTVMLQVSFPKAKKEALKDLAVKEGYSVSGLIKKTMLDILKKNEEV